MTADQELAKSLLEMDEGPTVDFKSSSYKFTNDHYKALFVKDIISMANTPREGSSYILTGVSRYAGGKKEIKGVSEHPDDANLQQLLIGKVRPLPTFHYRSLQYGVFSLGIIEIPSKRNGPYVPIKDFGDTLHRDVVYFRRGSSNDVARPEDLREIVAWMSKGDESAKIILETPSSGTATWDLFFETCEKFRPGWRYVLCLNGNGMSGINQLNALGRVDWGMVIDFDPCTDTTGIFPVVKPELEVSRSVHLRMLDDKVVFNLDRGTYWFAGSGVSNRPTTLCGADWRSWYLKYSGNLHSTALEFVKAAGERPIIVISLIDDPNFVRSICEAFLSSGGDSVKFVFGSNRAPEFGALSDTFGGLAVPIGLDEICQGLSKTINPKSCIEAIELPGWEEQKVAIPPDKVPWLEENVEFVRASESGESNRQEFLRGKLISWGGLELHYDIDREKTNSLENRIERDLRDRSIRIHYVYHWPGSGGTTIARRITFNLHKKYPVVSLQKYTGNETVGRLRYIFDLTRAPLLVLVEGSDIPISAVYELRDEALRQQLPIVFLVVLRTFDPIAEKENIVFVPATLNIAEAKLFAASYAEIKPDAKAQLLSLVASPDILRRNVFFFGLVTFEKNLVSIGDYVSRRIRTSTAVQQEILVHLAIAYKYGQKALPEQVFANLLGLPQNRIVQLDSVLPGPIQEIIIQESQSNWRPAHTLIAQELLEQILAGNAPDRRVWTQNLSSWACKFIDLCAGVRKTISDQLIDVLNRIFILREYGELVGSESAITSKYAQIIDEIDNTSGKITVFRKLVESFPSNAHYWGHLGRIYALEIRDYNKAKEAINTALSLEPNHYILLHMKGMVLRQEAYEAMNHCLLTKSCSVDEMTIIKSLVEQAGKEFAAARLTAPPQEEHAHVSDIQMIIRTVDFGFQMSSLAREEFLISPQNDWYRELLNLAEDILSELKRKFEGWELDQYIVSCETSIRSIYGDFARVLEGLRNYLDRSGVYKPPLRKQLAHVYLRRSNGSWDDLSQRDLQHIADLMTDNIRDNPADDKSISTWFQSVRRISGYDMQQAIERLTYWKANSLSIDAKFYIYILHVLIVIDGSVAFKNKAKDLIVECSKAAGVLHNRHNSIEWYGKGSGMNRIVYHRRLGKWEDEFEKQALLQIMDGQISSISGPEAGKIEMTSGLEVFFVPNRGYKGTTYAKGRDENKKVKFFLAFSYDGLRAWSVRDA